MKRRDWLKTVCATGGATLAATGLRAAEPAEAQPVSDRVGVLVDTTKCIGCRMCEFACARANDLPEPEQQIDRAVRRDTTPDQWTVVNRYETEQGVVYRKQQCMHCLQPACASACLTKAMYRTPEGPVIWRESKCMGCRFCMVSCPFDVPKFEYDSPVPKIQKCQLCWSRLQEGEQPACVAGGPTGAITFGKRRDLLDEARDRIYHAPDKYVHHVYGEDEVGGTTWLYLSAVPFDQIGLRTDIGDTAFPAYTREFLYAVPLVLTLAPPFLLALSRASRAREVAEEEGEGGEA